MADLNFTRREYPRLRTHERARKSGKIVTYYFWDGRSSGVADVALGTDLSAAIEQWRRCEAGEFTPVIPSKPKRKIHWGDGIPAWAKHMYLGAETRSRDCGREFTLTLFDLRALITRAGGRCELSGIEFVERSLDGRQPFSPSLDRIDSSKGYTADNVRIVCFIANVAMNTWGLAPLLVLAEHLKAER